MDETWTFSRQPLPLSLTTFKLRMSKMPLVSKLNLNPVNAWLENSLAKITLLSPNINAHSVTVSWIIIYDINYNLSKWMSWSRCRWWSERSHKTSYLVVRRIYGKSWRGNEWGVCQQCSTENEKGPTLNRQCSSWVHPRPWLHKRLRYWSRIGRTI